MSETIIGIILGGILATLGGFIQNWYQARKENKSYIRIKRDEAYLGYIEALLNLKENHTGIVQFGDFNSKYSIVKSKLKLYSSNTVLKEIEKHQDMLYECWECNGVDINDAIPKINSIIDILRKDLNVK